MSSKTTEMPKKLDGVKVVQNMKNSVNYFNSTIVIIFICFLLNWLISDNNANIAFYIGIAMGIHDKCMSGEIFQSKKVCEHPELRDV